MQLLGMIDTRTSMAGPGQAVRVIKRQFGFVKGRYRGLFKNSAQLMTSPRNWRWATLRRLPRAAC